MSEPDTPSTPSNPDTDAAAAARKAYLADAARPGGAAANIPHGPYCYTRDPVTGAKTVCPYWARRGDRPAQLDGYCGLLDHGDWMEDGGVTHLFDQLKECGVNDDAEDADFDIPGENGAEIDASSREAEDRAAAPAHACTGPDMLVEEAPARTARLVTARPTRGRLSLGDGRAPLVVAVPAGLAVRACGDGTDEAFVEAYHAVPDLHAWRHFDAEHRGLRVPLADCRRPE